MRLSRRQTALVWAVWLASVVVVALGVVTALPSGGNDAASIITGLTGSFASVTLATVGAILATRLPRNRVGWLLWAGGAVLGVTFGGSSPMPADLPGLVWLEWASNLLWVPAIVTVGLFVPLFFPTGRLPSRRWRAVVAVAIGALAVVTVKSAFSPFDAVISVSGLQNPLAIGGAMVDLLASLGTAATLAAVVCFPLVGASLVVRYRRASGVERAQLRWFATAASLVGLSFAVAIGTSSATDGLLGAIGNIAWELTFVGLALLPVAIGIAVLRYRLSEIDRLISRTISWAALSLVLGTLLASVTTSNTLAVAASTLVVATLFQPLRRRVQRLVDRRFNRARVDAEGTVAMFAGRLRDQIDLEQLGAGIAEAAGRAVEPRSVSLWLRP